MQKKHGFKPFLWCLFLAINEKLPSVVLTAEGFLRLMALWEVVFGSHIWDQFEVFVSAFLYGAEDFYYSSFFQQFAFA